MFKELIRTEMYVQKITQEKLAELIGTTQGNISQYLSGKRNIPTKHLEKIFEVLNLKLTK